MTDNPWAISGKTHLWFKAWCPICSTVQHFVEPTEHYCDVIKNVPCVKCLKLKKHPCVCTKCLTAHPYKELVRNE